MSLQAKFAEIARSEGRAALVTVLSAGEGAQLGARLLVHPDGSTEGTLGSAPLDGLGSSHAADQVWSDRSATFEVEDTLLFVDVTAPNPRLIIVGAIDFTVELTNLARVVGWRAFVIDPRAAFAREERFPNAERVLVTWPEEGLAELAPIDPATAIIVLTHDPKIDDVALMGALRSDAFFIGAMGSRKAVRERAERLRESGATDDDLERISSPVGHDLGAVAAGETALSIMAEVVAARYGRLGGPLSVSSNAIHATEAR